MVCMSIGAKLSNILFPFSKILAWLISNQILDKRIPVVTHGPYFVCHSQGTPPDILNGVETFGQRLISLNSQTKRTTV